MTAVPNPSLANAARLVPVAGVGCSAGGLAALVELVRHLQPDAGLALILMPHLDRTHPSELLGILGRVSPLPLHAIEEGLRVEANRIYVAPPNALVTLDDGLLQVRVPARVRGEHGPIDNLFASLARDRGARAIGVVLSGSGSDGSAGVRAIRAAGGATFAQDSSAEFRSMPDSAIATGCVDHVLPAEAIARELCLGAGAGGGGLAPPAAPPSSRQQLPLQARRLFMPAARFAALQAQAFPQLVAGQPLPATLRVWVPGCSTGEEAYSLAIGLVGYLTDRKLTHLTLQLFGTDVDHAALERARGGTYGAEIERDVSPEQLRSFFIEMGSSYKVSDDIRQLCVFAPHDPTNHPPLSRIDLISCPLLYDQLDARGQARLQSLFAYSLRESGILVLGRSELVPPASGFTLINAEARIYQRNADVVRPLFDFQAPHYESAPDVRSQSLETAHSFSHIQRAADRLLLARVAPPGVVLSSDGTILEFRGNTAPYLEIAPGLATLDLLRMARQELRGPLREALAQARASGAPARREAIRIAGQPRRLTNIEVAPFQLAASTAPFFIVIFEDPPGDLDANASAGPFGDAPMQGSPSGAQDELVVARHSLQALVAQLETSNEELRVANEEAGIKANELQSANEQLRLALEELHTVNEELVTVNEETSRNREDAARARDDLSNVLDSVDIPILMLGADLRIRRFAAAATRLLGVTKKDVGRPLSDFSSPLVAAALALTPEVLQDLRPRQRTLQDATGHWYQLNVRPYLTERRRIDGTVVFCVSIDEIQRASQRVADSQEKLRQMAFDATLTEERERRRLAADLHDRIGQALAVAQLKLKAVRETPSAQPAIDEVLALLSQSSGDMRSLVFDLSPPILYDLGLRHALSWLAEDLGKRWGLQIEVHDDGNDDPLSDATAAIAFRAVRELLTNVLKHAQTPAAEISLQRQAGQLEVSVQDRGVGFNLATLDASRSAPGFGLFSVREQINRLGGSVEVTSALGQGTRVTLRLPLQAAPSAADEARGGELIDAPEVAGESRIVAHEDSTVR